MVGVMNDDELLARVRELRKGGSSPKEIARKLGLRPAEVAPLVRRVASFQATVDPAERPLVGCWVNAGWSDGLGLDDAPGWAATDPADGEPTTAGLVSVLVARQERAGRATVCGYLTDVYCLGVKNVVGPLAMRIGEVAVYRSTFFQAFDRPPVSVPLDLAQHLVHGAVTYARGLGFEPAPDLPAVLSHLGSPSGPTPIRFGREGRPFYVSGPYDDARSVMRTLDAAVGPGNYDFLTAV